MSGGSGASALAAIGVGLLAVTRVIYRAGRFEQSLRARRPAPPPTGQWVNTPPRSPMVSPAGWPEDLKVQFAQAARVAVARGFVTPLMLTRALGVDVTGSMRLVWALESTGVTGPRDPASGQARTLVTVAQLPEVFAYWGIVEDTPPAPEPRDAAPPSW